MLTGTTTPGQSWTESNGNKGMTTHLPELLNWNITTIKCFPFKFLCSSVQSFFFQRKSLITFNFMFSVCALFPYNFKISSLFSIGPQNNVIRLLFFFLFFFIQLIIPINPPKNSLSSFSSILFYYVLFHSLLFVTELPSQLEGGGL